MILIYEDYVVELSPFYEKMSHSRGDLAYLRYYVVLLKLCLNMVKRVKIFWPDSNRFEKYLIQI